jgi:hypothetical protein
MRRLPLIADMCQVVQGQSQLSARGQLPLKRWRRSPQVPRPPYDEHAAGTDNARGIPVMVVLVKRPVTQTRDDQRAL